MKRTILHLKQLYLLPLAIFLLWGCATPESPHIVTTAAHADSAQTGFPWIFRRDTPLRTSVIGLPAYDLVYVYPTLVADRDKPLMDFNDPAVMRKARDFSAAQTRIFRSAGRVFVPPVRQLEFTRCVQELKHPLPINQSAMRPGIDDTKQALQAYLQERNGRPFILFGHSQGAINLYHALREMPELSPENGLVAAYLPGLPRTTADDIRRDFNGRLRPGAAADDTGVILVWNTQEHNADNPLFTVPGGYVINPLNWRTDTVPAQAKDNLRSEFYDWITGKSTVSIGFCGAVADPHSGSLMVSLPRNAAATGAEKLFGPGIHHISDAWLFAGNLDANAVTRVRAWLTSPANAR